MIDKKELMDTLENDISVLERKIKYKRLYNIRNLLIHKAINTGLTIEKILPYLVSAFIVYCSETAIGNRPFHIDRVIDDSYIQIIENKDGILIEKQSFDIQYKNNYLEYSTNWELNNNGLYERVITSYEIDNSINLDDKDSIINMSIDELNNLLYITDIRTIQKDKLNEDDLLYQEPMIILTTVKEDDKKRERDETSADNINYSFIYVVLSLGFGLGLDKVKKVLVNTYIVDELEKIRSIYEIIDIDDLQKLLQIKLNNMEKLKGSSNRQSPGYIYTLRKRG